MGEILVTINEALEAITELVTKDPARHDITINDAVAVQDRIILPAQPAIHYAEPPRGRHNEAVVITGVGFNPVAARNTVTMAGFGCAVVSATETKITFTTTWFLQFVNDAHIWIEVENDAIPGSYARLHWWVKSDADTIADRPTESQIAGPRENPNLEDWERPQAKDWERLATVVDHLCRHEPGGLPGDMLVGTGVGLGGLQGVNPDLDAAELQVGQAIVAEPPSVRFGFLLDVDLPFGGELLTVTANALLVAGGSQDATLGGGNTKNAAATAGVLDLVHLFCYRPAGTDTIDRVEVLVESVVQFNSGTGLGLGHQAVYAQEISVQVVKTDEVEVRVYKLGATVPIEVVGGVRMELD